MKKVILTFLSILVPGLMLASPALATPSEEFFERGADVYDSFGISRSRSAGEDGFLQLTESGFDPIIARESLGENADLAWRLGLDFANKYPDRRQRAEQIFYFVRDRVTYASDIDEFGREEFAQNADELAESIINNAAAGDCEDVAILMTVMYKAAGYRSAIVLAPGHAAALVFLPEYRKTGVSFTLEGEEGWIWLEATGGTNEMGWLAPALVGEPMFAREVTVEPVMNRSLEYTLIQVERASSGGGFSLGGISPFFGVVFVMWLLSSLRRRPTGRNR